MEQESQLQQRSLSVEDARAAFLVDLLIDPELLDEVETLGGINLSILEAITQTVGEDISYSPNEPMTIQRVHRILGVPNDREQIGEWRQDFFHRYKLKQAGAEAQA